MDHSSINYSNFRPILLLYMVIKALILSIEMEVHHLISSMNVMELTQVINLNV